MASRGKNYNLPCSRGVSERRPPRDDGAVKAYQSSDTAPGQTLLGLRGSGPGRSPRTAFAFAAAALRLPAAMARHDRPEGTAVLAVQVVQRDLGEPADRLAAEPAGDPGVEDGTLAPLERP